MGQSITTTLILNNTQQVQATREITKVLILPDSYIYWEIDTFYDGGIYRREWYNVPYKELANLTPLEISADLANSFETIIEQILWQATTQIDNITDVSKKRERYGVSFSYYINSPINLKLI